ncbi:MAG TPA: hypothetical protein PLT76_00890 [Candidatus Omnitrophota bacterium]|nr:hypothetical protein [Candidatus Omnitrophota bacterium]HPB68704.1 hypothetical protein [Candidatus Omnitrophota bacterium]HQO57265.1 hypothetical protein [Candidatus Omnitrophota bacterium]
MERIGLAASKVAKGNLVVYNLIVILLSFLYCSLMFLIAGATILFSLIVLGYIVSGLLPQDYGQDWWAVIRLCMLLLTGIVAIVNLYAVGRNFKFKRE